MGTPTPGENFYSLPKFPQLSRGSICPSHDPVTWYGINSAGTQVTQWDLQNKGIPAGLVRVPLFWKSHSVTCIRTM